MAGEPLTLFVTPPPHVPAEPFAVATPPPYSPANVIGDTLDEVPVPVVPASYVPPPDPRSTPGPGGYVPPGPPEASPGPPVHVPAAGPLPTPGPAPHVPAGAVDLVGALGPYSPDRVVGDTLDEVPNPATPAPHSPANVIGDTLDEVPEPVVPPAHVPDPGPEGSPSPPPHVPTTVFQDVVIEPLRPPPVSTIIAIPTPYVPPDITAANSYIQGHDAEFPGLLGHLGVSFGPLSAAGGASADVELYVRYLKDVALAMGAAGIAKFIAEQQLLYSLNDEGYGQIFNPLYFNFRAPFFNSATPLTVDRVEQEKLRGPGGPVDELIVRRAEAGVGPIADVERYNANSPRTPYSDAPGPTIGGLVDAALVESGDFVSIESPAERATAGKLVTAGTAGGVRRAEVSSLFTPNRERLGGGYTYRRDVLEASRAHGAHSVEGAFPNGKIPSSFPGELEDGSFVTTGQDPSRAAPGEGLPDSKAYMPLSFTDMRSVSRPDQRHRSVYIRPFDLKVQEALAPEWEQEGYYGRVGPVMGYRNTVQNYNLSFTMTSFFPEDVRNIHNKLHWLRSMVYPEYNADMIIRSGPVVRVRIGDLLRTTAGGVPGVITSLDMDYSEEIWELKPGYQVPRGARVSMGLIVVHDTFIGVRDGVFGAIARPERLAGPGDDPAAGPIRLDQQRERLDGAFSAFSEPRRVGR